MSAAGRALSKALESPDDWDSSSEFRIAHRPTGMAFWVANGSWWFDGDGRNTPPCLGRIERHWLYFKARKIRAKHRSPNHGAEVVARFEKAHTK